MPGPMPMSPYMMQPQNPPVPPEYMAQYQANLARHPVPPMFPAGQEQAMLYGAVAPATAPTQQMMGNRLISQDLVNKSYQGIGGFQPTMPAAFTVQPPMSRGQALQQLVQQGYLNKDIQYPREYLNQAADQMILRQQQLQLAQQRAHAAQVQQYYQHYNQMGRVGDQAEGMHRFDTGQRNWTDTFNRGSAQAGLDIQNMGRQRRVEGMESARGQVFDDIARRQEAYDAETARYAAETDRLQKALEARQKSAKAGADARTEAHKRGIDDLNAARHLMGTVMPPTTTRGPGRPATTAAAGGSFPWLKPAQWPGALKSYLGTGSEQEELQDRINMLRQTMEQEGSTPEMQQTLTQLEEALRFGSEAMGGTRFLLEQSDPRKAQALAASAGASGYQPLTAVKLDPMLMGNLPEGVRQHMYGLRNTINQGRMDLNQLYTGSRFPKPTRQIVDEVSTAPAGNQINFAPDGYKPKGRVEPFTPEAYQELVASGHPHQAIRRDEKTGMIYVEDLANDAGGK